jgi:hypothetical protein
MKRHIFAAGVMLGSTTAWAHGELGGGGGILSGLAHFTSSPISLACLVGLVAVVYAVKEERVPAIVIAAAISAGLASFLAGSGPAYVAPIVTALVGLVAVAALKPSNTAAILIAIACGFASGLAADLDPPSIARATGVSIAQAGLLSSALYTLPELDRVRKLHTVLPIARRVIGSWVAAIGLLMAALAIQVAKT